jgi:hypothetical protein
MWKVKMKNLWKFANHSIFQCEMGMSIDFEHFQSDQKSI